MIHRLTVLNVKKSWLKQALAQQTWALSWSMRVRRLIPKRKHRVIAKCPA